MAGAIERIEDSTGDDAARLRERLDMLEHEARERTAEVHAALAAAQDRSYWLDRWHVDLNAVMRRPGAGLLRAAFRLLRALYRLVGQARRHADEAASSAWTRVVRAERPPLEDDSRDERAEPLRAPPSGAPPATPVSDVLTHVDARARDDPGTLAALARADTVVAAFSRTGTTPRAGATWIGAGPMADEVLRLIQTAHPELECRQEDTLLPNEKADAAFTVFAHASGPSTLERLAVLHGRVKPGGAIVLGVEDRTEGVAGPTWLATNVTPVWRIALYWPRGFEGDRDLYVLERA